MKEVKLKHFAGPFHIIPFNRYVQSPVGLVPKAGNQSRLIFHLSYDFEDSGLKSINHFIPHERCTMKYKDLDHAVRNCLCLIEAVGPDYQIWMGISNLKSAFHMVPLSSKWWPYLVLKARDLETNRWCFFVDKCLPFGASISCALFQRISDALAHITF